VWVGGVCVWCVCVVCVCFKLETRPGHSLDQT